MSGGKVLMTQALSIGGLFTDRRQEDVVGNVARMKKRPDRWVSGRISIPL